MKRIMLTLVMTYLTVSTSVFGQTEKQVQTIIIRVTEIPARVNTVYGSPEIIIINPDGTNKQIPLTKGLSSVNNLTTIQKTLNEYLQKNYLIESINTSGDGGVLVTTFYLLKGN